MKSTQNIIQFIILLTFSFFIFSCNSVEEKENEKTNKEDFEKQIESFSKSLEDIDKTMNLIDKLNKKMKELEEKVVSGEITREKANKIAEELNKTYYREIAKRSNINPASKLPDWALELGLSEPEGLLLDKDFSKETSVNNSSEGYNSIKLVYSGDYNTAIEQATIIAQKANIPLSKQYKKAFEFKERYGKELEGVSGIAFMNYEFGDTDIEYKISINVDQDSKLIINAINMQQMKNIK